MKTLITNQKIFFLLVASFFIQNISLGQSPPPLGATSSFALFTAVGAFTNIGTATIVTGDVGTNVGAFSAFPPGTLVGSIHVADPTSAQAATDVATAYSFLFGLSCSSTIGTTLGSGQILTPNVYCLGGASTLTGDLILDAQGDPNALFIFKINGALSTSTLSNVILTNSASLCNVYWQINGAFSLGDGSVFRGIIVANGAISLLEGSSLFGRGLSTEGAIDLHNNIVSVGMQPIVDLGNDTTFMNCHALTLTLDAGNPGATYLWNTTETTQTITVSTSGMYFEEVTNSLGCMASDTINVTIINTLPNADAGADKVLTCIITSIALSGTSSTAGATYSWVASGGGNIVSGDLTATPIVNAAGVYTLTVTNPTNGCTAIDVANVTLNNTLPIVQLGNDTTFMNCHAPTITLDAGNPGATYLWSTTETTQTISVSTSGKYYVTVTNSLGCTASDTIHVTIINNNIDVNLGPDTTVCGCIVLNAGYPSATHYWSSGQSYTIINACVTGTYWVTVSDGTCIDKDTIHITVKTPPVVHLGNDTSIVSGTLILNAGNPGASYLWSTGATTQTITIAVMGQYYVTITDQYGCTASDTINVNIILGINENAASDLRVKVSPNPSSDKTFSLSFNILERNNVEIRIMNVLGKVVYSEKLENFSGAYHKMITLKDMADGIYFTDVLNGSRRSTTKIIFE